MALNKDQLVSVAKTEDLKSLKVLKLEGLELSSCFKLLLREIGVSVFLLSLKNNVLSEIDIPLGFTNLRKLDLSTNSLSDIGGKDLWTSMPRLQVLYLHDNLLDSWDTFTSLSVLPRIMHLTLFNNPCIHLPQYRKFMIDSLPGLLALDFHISTQEERMQIQRPDPELAKIWIQDASDMRAFHQHLYKLRRKWEKCSPVIKIQSLWRRYCVRKNMGGHLSERDQHAITIQRHVRGWLLRLKLRKDLEQMLRDTDNEYLLFTPEQYLYCKAIRRIESWYLEFRKRRDYRKKRYNASTKLSAAYKKWRISRYGLPILKSCKIYVLKSQQRTLICMLRALAKHDPEIYHPANSIHDRMAPEFFEALPAKKSGFSFPELFNRITDCRTIKMIRFPDIENLPYSPVPLSQMIKWMGQAKILGNSHSKKISGMSISKTFCKFGEFDKLKKFRIRGHMITQSERKKYKELKLNLDDYLDLVEFKAPSLEFIQELFLMVLFYNKTVFHKDLPIFLPIFEVLLNRIKAVCTVQACWRGYRVRKENLLANLAIERRAIYCVQRWWRSIKFFQRMKWLHKLKKYLSEFTSPVVYMQEHLFQYLSASDNPFMFLEQYFMFYCSAETVFISKALRRKFLPDWVDCYIRIEYNDAFAVSDEEKTLQAVVLSGARVDIVKLQTEITDKPSVADSKLKFIKLEYRNIEEAKRRAAILFLKTLDHRTGSFVPLFTQSTLEHSFLMSKLRKIWQLRNINYSDPCPALEILAKALIPPEEVFKQPTEPVKIEITEPDPIFSPVHESLSPDFESEQLETLRHQISNSDILKQRVKRAREEVQRRQAEMKIVKQIELEMKMDLLREAKDHTIEVFSFRKSIEEKEIELKKSLIEAQNRKKQIFLNEKVFISQFAQARNMIGKLMKVSEVERFKMQSQQEINEKVFRFKQKNLERRELVQAILHEKFKSKKRTL